jgi:hypothetical protein
MVPDETMLHHQCQKCRLVHSGNDDVEFFSVLALDALLDLASIDQQM